MPQSAQNALVPVHSLRRQFRDTAAVHSIHRGQPGWGPRAAKSLEMSPCLAQAAQWRGRTTVLSIVCRRSALPPPSAKASNIVSDRQEAAQRRDWRSTEFQRSGHIRPASDGTVHPHERSRKWRPGLADGPTQAGRQGASLLPQ